MSLAGKNKTLLQVFSEDPLYVVIGGHLLCGLSVYGPFRTVEEANTWCACHGETDLHTIHRPYIVLVRKPDF